MSSNIIKYAARAAKQYTKVCTAQDVGWNNAQANGQQSVVAVL